MLRTPHTKACLNPLRMVLLLRDAHEYSSTTRTCAGTRLLLTHSCTNSLHKPKAFSLFLHTSPSQRPTSRQSYSPESSFTSSCHGVRRSTHHVLCAGGVWRAALQTRGLHRSAPRPTVTDECLSAGNEARCRRSLQANAALYGGAGTSWAAVLVCLCAVSGHPALLFTLRSAKLKGRHKGDVSFAGGKKDPSDRTVVDTALREAREELGVHVTEERVWGVLKPLRDMSGMMIAPVVANLGPLEALSFRPNPSEVEEIFTLTLEHLCQAQNRGYTHFRTGDRYGYTLPVFLSPRHRVWGLTAVALDQALRVIVPQEQLLDHSAMQ